MLAAADIQALLPHRAPLLLVRSFEVVVPGERGLADVRIDLDGQLWGTWCGRDLYPELVLEAAAQGLGLLFAAAPAAGEGRPSPPADASHLLLGFHDVVFHDDAPRAALDMEVTLIQRLAGMGRGRFQALSADRLVAEGELSILRRDAG